MPRLGSSRKRNMFSLKAKLKRRKQAASRLTNNLRGVEKKRADLRKTLEEVKGVVAAAITQAQHLPVTPADLAPGKPITSERASRMEKTMRKTTSGLALLTDKVSLLLEAITHEDATLKAAEREMKQARKDVETFVNDTLRVVNDITHQVTTISPDFTDDLRDKSNVQQFGDPYLISSFMRVRTRPRNASATGIYPRRRGGAVRKPQAADAPLAVKGETLAVPIK
jgi:hypothetical protein